MFRSLVRLVVVLVSVVAALSALMALLRRAIPSLGDETSDEVRLSAIGEARAVKSRSAAFRGGSSLSVMGATQLDLRNATVAQGGARLQIQAVMSAVKVLVPTGWLVRTDVKCTGSAVENLSARAAEDAGAEPDLLVSGVAVASAVAIANKEEEAAAPALAREKVPGPASA